MDTKWRHIVFWVLAFAIYVSFMSWMNQKAVAKKRVEERIAAEKAAIAKKEADEKAAKEELTPKPEGVAQTKPGEPAPKNDVKIEAAPEKAVPVRDDLVLGQDNAQHRSFARLTNVGAAVTYLQLNDYRREDRKGPLVLLHALEDTHPSFRLWIKGDETLRDKVWDVVSASDQEIIFRTTARGGKLEVTKRFFLQPDNYVTELDLSFRSLVQDRQGKVEWVLASGNGLPLEGVWYDSFHRHSVAAMTPPQAYPYLDEQFTAKLVSSQKGNSLIEYSALPIQYAGVVCRYFATLIVQSEDALATRVIQSARPEVLKIVDAKPEQSNVGMLVTGQPIELEGDATATHRLLLYNGPKDVNKLAAVGHHLDLVIHYTDVFYLPVTGIAKILLVVLSGFYSLVHDYGLAIILLTIVVRGCMFPLSYRQTMMGQKMQELQPKIEELKLKYPNDKEKLNRELMEIYRKSGVNPLGGCLPILIQLPIFAGLWQALQNSILLRQASFLYGYTWINDLSAPDQLFKFGVDIPWIGPFFNLLPIIAVIQMVIQVKVMSPPATTPEMQMQQQMMTFMMVFMGFIFYRFPSGLCLYVITSGLWSFAERKLLPKRTPPKPLTPAAPANDAAVKKQAANPTWIVAGKEKKANRK